MKAVVWARGIGLVGVGKVSFSQNSVAVSKKIHKLRKKNLVSFYSLSLSMEWKMSFKILFILPKWNLHMSFKAWPSRSPPNSIITLKNFTAHWECKQPGPGLERTSLHFLETVMHNNEYIHSILLVLMYIHSNGKHTGQILIKY